MEAMFDDVQNGENTINMVQTISPAKADNYFKWHELTTLGTIDIMSASARQQDKGFADKRPNLGLRQLVEMPIYNGAFSNEL